MGWSPSTFQPDDAAPSAPAAAWTPSTFTPDEAAQPQGYLSRVGSDLKNRFGEAVQSVGLQDQGQQSGLDTGLQILGKTMAGSVNDVVGEGLKSAINYTPQPVIDAAKQAGNYAANTKIGQMGIDAAKQGMNAYKEWAATNPRAARDLESAVDVASMYPVAKGVAATGDVLASGVEKAFPNFGTAESVAAKELKGVTPAVASKVEPHVPLKAFSDLADTAFGNIERANKYYDLPAQIAGEQTAKAPQVKEYLESVVKDIQSDPYHEAKPMLPKLQKTLESLPEDGSVPVNDLIDLRRASNKNFKPGRMNDKDGVYAGLNKAVNAGLDDARENIPHFSDALDVADGYWKNSVATPILNNKVLQNVFKMEDAHNIRQFNNGQIDEVPDATKQAANNMLSKIKDVDTYNAVRRMLPDDTGRSLDAALLDSVTPSWLDAAVKLAKSNVVHPFESIRNIADIISPNVPPNQKALIAAIKKQNTYTPLSVKNEAAENAFNAVKAANQYRTGLLEGPSIKVPEGGFAVRQPAPAPADVNYNPNQQALPRYRDMTADDMARAGRLLPSPDKVPIRLPNGPPKRTYNPYDLNREGDVSTGKSKGGIMKKRAEAFKAAKH